MKASAMFSTFTRWPVSLSVPVFEMWLNNVAKDDAVEKLRMDQDLAFAAWGPVWELDDSVTSSITEAHTNPGGATALALGIASLTAGAGLLSSHALPIPQVDPTPAPVSTSEAESEGKGDGEEESKSINTPNIPPRCRDRRRQSYLKVSHRLQEDAKLGEGAIKSLKMSPVDADSLRKLVEDQYVVFELLEPHLHRPQEFLQQMLFGLPQEVALKLIDMYYQLDDRIIHSLLDASGSKKRLNREKKELRTTATKVGIGVQRVSRELENVRRVERWTESSTAGAVSEMFQLSPELSCHYEEILFIAHNKLDTRKECGLPWSYYRKGVRAILLHWVNPAAPRELDRTFVSAIRNNKGLLTTPVLKNVARSLPQEFHTKAGLAADCLRHMVDQCSTYSSNRELRDVFPDVMSIAELLRRKLGLDNRRKIRKFFKAVVNLTKPGGVAAPTHLSEWGDRNAIAWVKYITVVSYLIQELPKYAKNPSP